MEVINTENAASVILFDLRVSEGELQYIAIALEYVLKNLSNEELHSLFDESDSNVNPTETQEFLEGMLERSTNAIRQYCIPKYLPKRFRASDDMANPSLPTIA